MAERDPEESRVEVRVVNRSAGVAEVNLSGIPEDALGKVQGALAGHNWLTVKDGKIVFSSAYEPLPNPVLDKEMLPFWRRNTDRGVHIQHTLFDTENLQHCSPSFMVANLCGYQYTEEGYRHNAILLRSYGFECMRSQRGDDGRYWENWYLPGAWAAEGDLKEALRDDKSAKSEVPLTQKTSRETSKIVEFLCRYVSFGTLDVVVQRAAMVTDY